MFRILFLLLIVICACSTENPLCTEDDALTLEPIADATPDTTVDATLEVGDWELDRGDWELLVTLPRHNLTPAKLRIVDEWIDPITQAYVDGKDFLFLIYQPKRDFGDGAFTSKIFQARYYLEQPGLLHQETSLLLFHFPDPDAWWFRYWGNAAFQDRTRAGFTVSFDTTPMFKPANPDVKKQREYLFPPEFGTSLEGDGVAGWSAPEIEQGLLLNIYTR